MPIAPDVLAKIRRYGSPNFPHIFGAIVAGANEYVEMAAVFPRSVTFSPLTDLLITNNSSQFVDLELNGVFYARLPAGVTGAVNDSAIWTFRITNNDITNVVAGRITANISTPPLGADELARIRFLGVDPFQ